MSVRTDVVVDGEESLPAVVVLIVDSLRHAGRERAEVAHDPLLVLVRVVVVRGDRRVLTICAQQIVCVRSRSSA